MTETISSSPLQDDLHPGDLLNELYVTDLTIEGFGVARRHGRVVFVDGALPGSLVSARVVSKKKQVLHAAMESVCTPSPHAVLPWCPHAGDCGGCLWQHFSRNAALEWKQKHVGDCLARIGKCADVQVSPVLSSEAGRAFRNKMAFAFASDPHGVPILGLRRRRSQTVLPVTGCGLQRPVVMDLLASIRETIGKAGLRAWTDAGAGQRTGHDGYLRFIVVHTPDYAPRGEKQLLVECITGRNHKGRAGRLDQGSGGPTNAEAIRSLGEDLMRRFSLTGFIHTERNARSDVAQGERVIAALGSMKYTEKFGDLVLEAPYNTFLQTNTTVANLLYARIAEEAALDGSQVLWDLYSGVGSIALYLAKGLKEAHGFEIQAEAVTAARDNSAALGFSHCRFHAGAFTSERAASLPAPDLIIADPPRAGLEQGTLGPLLGSPAHTLMYVSCDVGTQARDLARLAPSWKPIRSIPFDMFPYTPHVENLIVLKRRAG